MENHGVLFCWLYVITFKPDNLSPMVKETVNVTPASGSMRTSIFESVVRTLLYFDIFNYPLRKEEILHFLSFRTTGAELEGVLETMTSGQYIYQFNEFFSIQDKRENIARRVSGNEMARAFLPLAIRKARLIARFPFVRAVMASGSLSKNYMDKNSDLDFFIVTAPQRLWIARMMLVLYKRVFLANSHKHFCVNYFVTSDSLEIMEKNQFTATELATVIPLYNDELYLSLLKCNAWINGFFPNFIPRPVNPGTVKVAGLKKILERVISAMGADALDKWCMKQTHRRWEKLYEKQYSKHDFGIAFKTDRNVSKNHPRHYQKKITELLEQKWKGYREKFNIPTL